jgi:hypothetical protein
MSTFALAGAGASVFASWETDGQVYWTSIDASTGRRSAIISAPGSGKSRKHSAIAVNRRGEMLLVWTEGTAWNQGGGVAWQVFDRDGRALGPTGRAPGLPPWGLAAAVQRPDDSFVVLY